MTMINGDIF